MFLKDINIDILGKYYVFEEIKMKITSELIGKRVLFPRFPFYRCGRRNNKRNFTEQELCKKSMILGIQPIALWRFWERMKQRKFLML